MDIVRRILTWLFRFNWVEITDFQGKTRVRKVWWRGSRPVAVYDHVFFIPIATINLMDGGKTTGISYVKTWEPYNPAAAKTLPRINTGDTT